jgi:hypothetical protein
MPIVRAPSNGKITGIVTSTRAVYVPTHWFGGRTQPCTEPQCPACEQHRPQRWHAYLTIWSPNDNTHVLCELPEAASHRLADLADTNTSLRGGKIAVFRNGPKQNSRVICNYWPTPENPYKLPNEPNIRNILEHVWRLDRPAPPNKNDAQPPALKIKQA